jgi:hypothetical protein
MPGGNGLMVAERLQNSVHLTGIPMIFITPRKPGLFNAERMVQDCAVT